MVGGEAVSRIFPGLLHTYIRIYTYICTWRRGGVTNCVRALTCIHVCIRIYTHIYISTYITCICIYHIYVYTYIHTHEYWVLSEQCQGSFAKGNWNFLLKSPGIRLSHVYISTYTYTYTHIYKLYIHMYIYTYIYIHIYICIYICVYIHTCTYIYTYIYICIYMHMGWYHELCQGSFAKRAPEYCNILQHAVTHCIVGLFHV